MNEKYGVPRDINAKVKIIGLFMADIVFVGGSAVAALSIGTKIFPTSQWPQASCDDHHFIFELNHSHLLLCFVNLGPSDMTLALHSLACLLHLLAHIVHLGHRLLEVAFRR